MRYQFIFRVQISELFLFSYRLGLHEVYHLCQVFKFSCLLLLTTATSLIVLLKSHIHGSICLFLFHFEKFVLVEDHSFKWHDLRSLVLIQTTLLNSWYYNWELLSVILRWLCCCILNICIILFLLLLFLCPLVATTFGTLILFYYFSRLLNFLILCRRSLGLLVIGFNKLNYFSWRQLGKLDCGKRYKVHSSFDWEFFKHWMHEIAVWICHTQTNWRCFKSIFLYIYFHLWYYPNLYQFLIHLFNITILQLIVTCSLCEELSQPDLFLTCFDNFLLNLCLHRIFVFLDVFNLLS